MAIHGARSGAGGRVEDDLEIALRARAEGTGVLALGVGHHVDEQVDVGGLDAQLTEQPGRDLLLGRERVASSESEETQMLGRQDQVVVGVQT